jgi:hypothetical protein
MAGIDFRGVKATRLSRWKGDQNIDSFSINLGPNGLYAWKYPLFRKDEGKIANAAAVFEAFYAGATVLRG